MPSMYRFSTWAGLVGYVRQIRSVDPLAAIVSATSIAFILFVVLQG